MNDTLYWSLFEEAWNAPSKDAYDALKRSLNTLSLHDLLLFSKMYSDYRDALCRPTHVCATYLLYGGVIFDEIFSQYTEGVAGVPKALYLDVLEDPDRLLNHPLYQDVLQLDAYPFASLPVILGKQNFDRDWFMMSRQDEWNSTPSDIDSVELGGHKGADIISPELCQQLVPRLYNSYHAQCDWLRNR